MKIKFKFTLSLATVVKRFVLRQLFEKAIVCRSAPLFLKVDDVISTSPIITGSHEPEIEALLEKLAECGRNDFLVDIGANIGLTSCISGRHFKKIVAYEPNPFIFNIAASNFAISLRSESYNIFNVGLGNEDKVTSLTVPKCNFGGAFIADDNNRYTSNELARKDGFNDLRASNYIDIEIRVVNAEVELRQRFSELMEGGAKFGVVKIDVEGYEYVIIRHLSNALPDEMQAVVIFENWSVSLTANDLRCLFPTRSIEIFKLRRCSTTRLQKIFNLIRKGALTTQLVPVGNDDLVGDIVVFIQFTTTLK